MPRRRWSRLALHAPTAVLVVLLGAGPTGAATEPGPVEPDGPVPGAPVGDPAAEEPEAPPDPLASLTPEERASLLRYEASVREAAGLSERLVGATVDLLAADAARDQAALRLAETQRRWDGAQRRFRRAEQTLDRERRRLRDQAVRVYMDGRQEDLRPVTDALSGSASATRSRATQVYARVVMAHQRDAVGVAAERLAGTVAARDAAAAERDRAAADLDEAARRRDAASERWHAIEGDRRRALERADGDRRRLEAVAGGGGPVAERLAAARSSVDAVTPVLAARQRGQVPRPPGGMTMPVTGPVSSGFGPRVDPVVGGFGWHDGIDLALAERTPLVSPADGTVVVTGDQGGYGLVVVVDHGDGVATLLAHLAEVAVTPGDPVRRGDVVGLSGNTGRSTGPHLHLEVRLLGVPTDPLPWFGP